MYAELYIKIIDHKVLCAMVAIRGTDNWQDCEEDISTWWKSLLETPKSLLNDLSYFQQLMSFFVRCNDTLHKMDELKLLPKHMETFVTGHSLGGALANMACGSMLMPRPTPAFTISFNAPGIGAMKGIRKEPVVEGRVLSMRAHYDFASAVGEPYGYVINNRIPEKEQEAKTAFQKEAIINYLKTSKIGQRLELVAPNIKEGIIERDRIIQTTDFIESVQAQHSMNNFLRVICSSIKALTHYKMLHTWAYKNTGWNHDEKAQNWIAA